MRRLLWLGFGLLAAASLGAAGYVILTPRIGHATRAQIDAALPASLKVVDSPDPKGEARYARLEALVRGMEGRELEVAMGSRGKPADPAARARVSARGRPLIADVERLLAEGGIRYPERENDTSFLSNVKLKSFAKLLAIATNDAAARGDRVACARYSALGLRYGHALIRGGGVLIDGLVAIAVEAIATRAAYEAEMKGGLDAAGRAAVLAELPVRSGIMPEMGALVRRDFQAMLLPTLIDSSKLNPQTVSPAYHDFAPSEKSPAGTFDPVATARLAGGIYDAGIADAGRPTYAQKGEASRLARAAGVGLPQEDAGPELWYRVRMNAGRNTIGRSIASSGLFFENLSAVGARRAADSNLLRAVLLLRTGRPVALPDPYGRGNLRIDRQRRIVWSVGEDGKDDGGDIGTGYADKALDHGRRF